MSTHKTAGGTFDPAGAPIYFLAGHPLDMRHQCEEIRHEALIAVHELESERTIGHFAYVVEHAQQTLLDSGAFALANQMSLRQGIPLPEALALPLDQINGVPALLTRYREIARRFEEKLWGYVEVDLGGVDQKIATRTAMEAEGLRPIPVYHARTDGRDYLEMLVDRYDRIAVGNVVDASPADRLRYFRTVWQTVHERRATCWVHYLGVECGGAVYAYPPNSVDSSTWSVIARFGNNFREYASAGTLGPLRHELQPRGDGTGQASDETRTRRFSRLGVYRCHFTQANWRRYHHQLLTGTRYPEVPHAPYGRGSSGQ